MLIRQGAKERVERLYFSPDGQLLIVPSHSVLQLWEDAAVGGSPTTLLPYPDVRGVGFAHDGRTMVLDGSRVVIHSLATGQGINVCYPPPYESGASVGISPDGEYFVSAQSGHGNQPRGRLICRAVKDPAADLWLSTAARHFHSGPLFSPDGKRFVVFEWWNGKTGSEYGPAFVTRDAVTGEPLSESREQCNGYYHPVQSSDRRHVAARYENRITIFRTDDFSTPLAVIKNTTRKDFTGAAFHPSGHFMMAASNDATVKLYDTRSWAVARTFTWDIGRMRSVAFSADGMLAAAGSDAGKVVVWDVDV